MLRSTFVLLLVLVVGANAALASSSKSAKKAAADLAVTLEKLENNGWQAFKDRDEKAYAALCTSDYTAVNADQQPPHDLPSTIEEMKNGVTINSFKLSDFRITPLGPDAALVTYTAQTNLTFTNGKAQDAKLAVTDVWVKQRGQWKSLRYHESEIK